MSLQQVLSQLQDAFPTGLTKVVEWRGELAVTVPRERLHEVAQFLHDDQAMDLDRKSVV